MTIKSDKWIKRNVEIGNLLIEPFLPESVNTIDGKKVPSFGLSSYGYDIRLGRNFKVARHAPGCTPSRSFNDYPIHAQKNKVVKLANLDIYEDIVDVCDFDSKVFVEMNDVDEIIIPPHGFVLANSHEKVSLPRNTVAVCMGKSTIARSGLMVVVTPIEPGWTGYITLEIFNTLRLPVRLHAGIGITQLQFFESDEECETSYADRNGKYQNQEQSPIVPRN